MSKHAQGKGARSAHSSTASLADTGELMRGYLPVPMLIRTLLLHVKKTCSLLHEDTTRLNTGARPMELSLYGILMWLKYGLLLL